MRNTLSREFAVEARRSPRMSKLEKENRENRVASAIVGLFSGSFHEGQICGVKIKNVRFTDKGCSVDLEDGGTIACRITAYAPDEK